MAEYNPEKDISDKELATLIKNLSGSHPEAPGEWNDKLEQALLELRDRRREEAPENQPKFMSAAGDWALAVVLLAAVAIIFNMYWG